MRFGDYLLNEERGYLATKIGDVLNALQSLSQDADNLGNRHLIRASTGIVNQIRRILHDSWTDSEKKTLKTLQKVAVALMRGIDSNENMREVISTAVQVLDKTASDIGAPLNNLGSDSEPNPVD